LTEEYREQLVIHGTLVGQGIYPIEGVSIIPCPCLNTGDPGM